MNAYRWTRVVLTLWVAALTLTGCSFLLDSQETSVDEAGDTGEGVVEASEQQKEEPITVENAVPKVYAVQAEGESPRTIIAQFDRAMVNPSEVGKTVGEKTRFRVVPPVDGSLKWTSISSLSFTPDVGFVPGAEYRAELMSVETKTGDVLSPDVPWDVSFKTPELNVVRIAPTKFDLAKRAAVLDLVFSGPVRHNDLASRVDLTLRSDGEEKPLAIRSVRAGQDTRRVSVIVDAPKGLKGQLVARVDSGYASAVDPQAKGPNGVTEVNIAMTPKQMEIQSVHVVEGSNRFFIEVICHDNANSTRKRWMWNSNVQESFRVSPRCLLTEESVEQFVHTTPETELAVSPTKGGFRLSGALQRGEVDIRIDAGANTVDGGTLLSAFSRTLTISPLTPKVSFVAKGRYMPKGAWTNLPIQHRNVSDVTLDIRHVPEENLVFWLSGKNETATERTSNLVYTGSVAVSGTPDQMSPSRLDISQYIPNPDAGVYELTLSGSRGAKDTTRVLMTGMNLVAKMPQKPEGKPWASEIKAWVLDMHTGDRVGNVFIDAIRPSGKVMASCQTRLDGSCTLGLPEDATDKTPPMALIARNGTDHTYLKFSELKTPTSEFRVGGEAYGSKQKYRASVYGDRGVYRPGETAHVSVLVRNAMNRAPKTGVPVLLTLLDPRGKKVREKILKTNDVGLMTWDVGFSDYAKTGKYRITAKVGNRQVGAMGFSVEEFVPERMEVKATALAEHYLDSETVPVSVDARYLFGGSAEGSRFELSCRLEPAHFVPESAKQWTFGVKHTGKAQDLGLVSGTLKEEGKGQLSCPAPKNGMGFLSAAQVVAQVSVYEAGSGRTTMAQTTVPVHPEQFYIGLDSGVDKVSSKKPFTVSGIVVDWDGKPHTALDKVKLQMYRLESEWGYVYDPVDGTERYKRYMREVPDGRAEVTVENGKFSHTIQPSSGSAGYLVRARAGDTRTDLELKGSQRYWWSGEYSSDATPRPLKPGTVVINAPTEIDVGETVSLTFKAPYRGKALVSVETDQILRSEWMDVEAGDVAWSFALGEFNPNVYVSVLVVKDPHLDSTEAFIPDRAFGVTSLTVKPKQFTSKVTLSMPEHVRSNAPLEVSVDVGTTEPTYVTVAAVDVGILSLTNFKAPNPFLDIFKKRGLAVNTYETVGWAVHMQAMGNSSSTGGDEEGGAGGRVQMVKPVALWSGLVKADAEGKATVTFDVPQYRGKLRVMAVAASKGKMGHAEQDVIVKDPLVVQTTLPRFLTEGDMAEIPVFVTNMSGKTQEVTVDMNAEWLDKTNQASGAPFAFTGAKRAKFTLADGENKTSVFRVRVRARTGAATLKVQAKAGKILAQEQLDIPFESTGPRTRRVHMVEVDGAMDVTEHLTGWVPGTERTSLWLTNNPYGEAFAHMKYLIRYPYGCVEQTTSSTRPLLFASAILGASDPDLVQPEKIDKMVMHGVDRLMRMQTPSGGFAYWIGGDQPNLWGTAYATHLLLDAKKAGFSVPQDGLDAAVNYMDATVANQQNMRDQHSYTPGGVAYMHYVLARADKGRKAEILKAIQAMGTPSNNVEKEQQYMLQAALYLSGDRRYERALKNPDISALKSTRRNDWSFFSDLRYRGFMLSVYSDLFGPPESDTGLRLARLVADGLAADNRSYHYSTQEIVWGVTGLGKTIVASGKDFDGSLTVDGKTITPDSKSGGQLIWNVARASERGAVQVSESNSGKTYLVMNSEGVEENARWEYGANSMSVTRVYRNAEGDVLDLASHDLGDMVYIELRVTNLTSDNIQNVALVDRIPAGWEIENPRLGRGDRPDWVDEDTLWSADHMNLRDDRLELFGTLPRKRSRTVVYAVRAVTAGTYTIPPVKIEAMYDPEKWSRAPGREVTIRGPWAGFYL